MRRHTFTMLALLAAAAVRLSAQGGVPSMSTTQKVAADSFYNSVQRRLAAMHYHFERADPRARVLVVRAPGDSIMLEVSITASGDSSTFTIVAVGSTNMIASMQSTLMATHAATMGAEPAATPAAASAPSGPPGLAAGRWTYSANAEGGDVHQDMGLRTVTVASSGAGTARVWIVVAAMKLGSLAFIDSVTMSATGLLPVSRHALAGNPPGREYDVRLQAGDSLIEGTVVMRSRSSPVRVAFKKDSYLNYYSLRVAFAGVPLASGWSGDASALELGANAYFAPLKLRVVGSERIEVPAGSFDCWKISVTGQGIDEQYWVSKAGQFVVRTREPIGPPPGVLELDLTEMSDGR